MDIADRLTTFIEGFWARDILPSLCDYIRIPNRSPDFEPEWERLGFMDRAAEHLATWARKRLGSVEGFTLDVLRLPGRTPLILIDLPGDSAEPVLIYGHFDKQPELGGWAEGLSPWEPVIRDESLFGRGGADDGYAIYAALAAILALKAQQLPHPRCVILIEGSEESGSVDLGAYLERLAPRLGTPPLIVCLDSGCATYDQLWVTTSLRGVLTATLDVRVLTEGVHSGDASGVVPSSFRILRRLLSRIEDETTGVLKLPELEAQIPRRRLLEARAVAARAPQDLARKFPLVPGGKAATPDPLELILNRTWRPQLSVTGLDGAPPIADGGNVLRAHTKAKLSFRLPPTVNPGQAAVALQTALETAPPYGAEVRFELLGCGAGWQAPPLAPWLDAALQLASQSAFGGPLGLTGEGGTIPFIPVLSHRFPDAQYMICGVLGPGSNAHGPNERLHLPTARKITKSVALVLSALHAAGAASA